MSTSMGMDTVSNIVFIYYMMDRLYAKLVSVLTSLFSIVYAVLSISISVHSNVLNDRNLIITASKVIRPLVLSDK